MVIIKTKDIRMVLYSIARQLKNNDKIIVVTSNYVLCELQLNDNINKNQIEVMKVVSKIKKCFRSENSVSILINYVEICDITKHENSEFVIEDVCGKLLEYLVFELISEANKLKFEYKKESEEIWQVKKCNLDVTYSSDYIIDYQNTYKVFSHISTSITEDFKSLIIENEMYNVVITSNFVRDNKDFLKQCKLKFEFDIKL